jgi:nucleosome binding factor SPN SPT16 subunit
LFSRKNKTNFNIHSSINYLWNTKIEITMRKLSLYLIALAMGLFMACGGDQAASEGEVQEEEMMEESQDMEELETEEAESEEGETEMDAESDEEEADDSDAEEPESEEVEEEGAG